MKSFTLIQSILTVVFLLGLASATLLAEDKWNVTLEGRGRVFASGEGDISISGTVMFSVIGDGTVTVPAGAKVRKDGKWLVSEGETLQGKGRVTVELTGQEALINGKVKSFRARGEGTVKLMGTGQYKSHGFKGSKETVEKVQSSGAENGADSDAVNGADDSGAEIIDGEAKSALQEF